ncbi:MAG: PEP-CTERM sorting domain-containing protein [Pseudomonadales bacterium]
MNKSSFPSLRPATIALPLLVALAGASFEAQARAIRIDTTLAFCNIDESAGAEIAIGNHNLVGGVTTTQAACSDPTLFDPFSIRLGDTLYSTLHLNNDGLITFGSAYSGAVTDITDPGFGPAFAPFFTNTSFADSVSSGTPRISYGGSAFSQTPYLSINYTGGNSDSYYQLNILDRSGDTGVIGDFDLELSYTTQQGFTGIVQDQGGAQVGFNNGAGQSYLAEGSNVAGAFVGLYEDCFPPVTAPATALACTNFGNSEEGGFLFQFRNGVEINTETPPTDVPAPGALGLLLIGLGLLGRQRLSRAVRIV